MRTVDEILATAGTRTASEGAERQPEADRFPRNRHIDTVRRLSDVSGTRTTMYLATQWFFIFVTLFTVGYYGHWVLYLPAALIISSRMQALGVLLHDGVHYLLYKNRTVNDIVCDLFIAFPLGMSTTLYRKTHFRHHRFTNTEEDQDLAAQREEHEWFAWPKTKLALAWTLFRTAFGLNFHRGWILYKHWAPWNHFFKPVTPDFPIRARALYVLSMIVVYSSFVFAIKASPSVAIPLMALYMLCGMTLLNIINRLRATAEHLGTEGSHELNATRTVLPSIVERLLVAPYGVNYHLEHHLFPSVPGCNLPQLHDVLMKDDEFREHAHITKTYVGVISELMNDDRDDAKVPQTFAEHQSSDQ